MLYIWSTGSPQLTITIGTRFLVINFYSHKLRHVYDQTWFYDIFGDALKQTLQLYVWNHSSKWLFIYFCWKQQKMSQFMDTWLWDTAIGHKISHLPSALNAVIPCLSQRDEYRIWETHWAAVYLKQLVDSRLDMN